MSPPGRPERAHRRAQHEIAPVTLVDLLDSSGQFDAEYHAGPGVTMSNHLPMALVALKRLGASDSRLAEFAAGYSQRLHAAPAPTEWPAGDPWRGALGQPAAWPAYRHLFLHWLVSEGAGPVLQQTLPVLVAGCGAAAFHGLVRTAYAVQCGHGQELADALAYWACRWFSLDSPLSAETFAETSAETQAGTQADPAPLLKALGQPMPGGALIVSRMNVAARQPGFDASTQRLRIDAQTLPRLARLGARLFSRSGNSTTLRLVTSAQALGVLLPFIDEPLPARVAVAGYWRAFAAGFVASGVVPGRAPPARPWTELMAAAVASDVDHLIELVDACRQAQTAAGGADAWQRAATRAVNDV